MNDSPVQQWTPNPEYFKTDLTPAELKALQDAANGFTTGDSAIRMHKSPETIKSQRAAVVRKLGASNIAHAVKIALQKGLIH